MKNKKNTSKFSSEKSFKKDFSPRNKKDFNSKDKQISWKKFWSNKSSFKKELYWNIDTSKYEKIVWKYAKAKNYDFGFIDVEWLEKWYFVYPKNTLNALDWDEVEAYVKDFKWRKEAVVTKVISRADRIFVWKISLNKSFGFVILDTTAVKNDVYISEKNLKNYKWKIKNWDKVAIKISKWNDKNPEWRIIDVLWDENSKWNDVRSLILEAWIRENFPDFVIEEASKLKFTQDENRIDLTKILTFTIDWDDARDLDDAISIEKSDKWYKLIVSIADVSNYVLEDSKLDKEALKRWNSTYLADRVIPMLPEKLSNDLCSLNANTKKLTLSCEILLDEKWFVKTSKVYNSVIKSSYRLTYKEVEKIFLKELSIWDELSFWWLITPWLINSINYSYELKRKINQNKQKLWVLNFDFDETKVILDNENNPIDIIKYERLESHKVIEEFMILANESVWYLFSKIPFLYRIHDIPDDDDIEKLRKILASFDIVLPYKEINPILISEVLSKIDNHPKKLMLSKIILRSLKKAIYSEDNRWHFWLSLDFYSHFTSPIRRYSDLQIHRIIKEYLLKNKLEKSRIEHYKEILPEVAKRVSDTELKSEKLEYAVRDLMIAKYYKDKIWLEFEWTISWMIPLWFFVLLENSAEWMVNLENFLKQQNYKKYNFEDDILKLNFENNFSIQVWDRVKIKIESVDIESRRINFDFVSKL